MYHYWDRRLAVLSFGADLVRTLVSTATKKSHRHMMGENVVLTVEISFFNVSSSNLQITKSGIKSPITLILALFRLLA